MYATLNFTYLSSFTISGVISAKTFNPLKSFMFSVIIWAGVTERACAAIYASVKSMPFFA